MIRLAGAVNPNLTFIGTGTGELQEFSDDETQRYYGTEGLNNSSFHLVAHPRQLRGGAGWIQPNIVQ